MVLGVLWFGAGATPATSGSEAAFSPPAVAGTEASGAGLTVHVSGDVGNPGLVTVPRDARVADVIAAAGGALRSADLTRLNLAAAVRDAEHIHVPSQLDPGGAAGSNRADPSGVDLNQASAEELEQLPGVGPVLAQRIAAYRDEHGPFAAVEDLLGVPGIGEGKLAQLRDAVSSP